MLGVKLSPIVELVKYPLIAAFPEGFYKSPDWVNHSSVFQR